MGKAESLSEEVIAGVVQQHLTTSGWSVYPEVDIPIFGGRPDMIATKGALCQVVEAKSSLSYAVIEQLTRWHLDFKDACKCEYSDERILGIPHLMVAAVSGVPSFSRLKRHILRQHRIGVISVFPPSCGTIVYGFESQPITPRKIAYDGATYKLVELITPGIQPGARQAAQNIIRHLNEDMKGAKPGITGVKDSYMTPFKRTFRLATEFVAEHQPGTGVHLANIVEALNQRGGHHYSNDRSALTGLRTAFEREGWVIQHARVQIPAQETTPAPGST